MIDLKHYLVWYFQDRMRFPYSFFGKKNSLQNKELNCNSVQKIAISKNKHIYGQKFSNLKELVYVTNVRNLEPLLIYSKEIWHL